MAIIDVSGEIFTLDAQAGFTPGLVKGRVGAGARLSYQARAELCHGIELALNATAMADAQAALTVFLPAITAQGAALAAAGVSGRLVVKPDLFDKFGFSADILANAEASVAGRLALAADFSEVARLAEQRVTGLALNLFNRFLREIKIEAGVWGKASVSAMAGAYIDVSGSFAEDSDAGFVISAGFDVGAGAGTGWDFYAGVRFEEARRWYNASTRMITLAIAKEARVYLPSELQPAVQWLEFGLPLALSLVYDLGQQASMAVLAQPELKASALLTGLMRSLQYTVLDKVAELGQMLLTELLGDLTQYLLHVQLSQADLLRVRAGVRTLILSCSAGELTLDTFVTLATTVVELVATVSGNAIEPWQRALTLIWTSIAATKALGETYASASASAGAIGAGTVSGAAQGLTLAEHHGIAALEAEFKRFFGPSLPSRLSFEQAIDYLLYGAGVQHLIAEHVPGLAELMDRLASDIGISVGDVISTMLLGAVEPGSTLPLYRKLRAFLQHVVDDRLLHQLVAQLEAVLPTTAEAMIYLVEVVRPSLAVLSAFIFDHIDSFVDNGPNFTAFVDPLRQAASLAIYKIAVHNIAVLSDILLEITHAQLETQFKALETSLRNGTLDTMVSSAVAAFVPAHMVVPNAALHPATQEFLAEIMGTAAEMCGPRVWSLARRRQYRQLITNVLLGIDGDADYRSPNKLDVFIADLAECAALPALDDVLELSKLSMNILADHFRIAITRLVPAFATFALFLGEQVLSSFERAAKPLLDAAAAAAQQARQQWEAAQERVNALADQIDQITTREASNLRELKDLLASSRRRREILARLLSEGLDMTRQTVRSVPGFDLQPPDWQHDQIAAAQSAFQLAWNLVQPHVDQGLQILSSVAGSVGNLIAAAPNPARVVANLSDRLEADLTSSLRSALGGVMLPNVFSIEHIAQLAANLITSLPAVKDAINEAFDLRKERNAKEQDKATASALERSRRQTHQNKAAEARELRGERLMVKINEPLPFVTTTTKVYRTTVRVDLLVQGATAAFVRGDHAQRVLLAVNGVPLNLAPTSWRTATQGQAIALTLTLDARKAPSLHSGMNVLECSVTNGSGERQRETVVFQFLAI